MDNVNQPPPGQGPAGNSPTQPYRFTPGWPGGAQGGPQGGPGYGPPPGGPQWQQAGPPPGPQGPQGPQGPYAPPKKRWKHSKRLRWTAGITAAALLGAGGALAGLKLTGSGGSASNDAAATALATALSGTSSCLTPSSGGKSGDSGKRCLQLQLHQVKGMYGEIAYHASNGTETLAYERGTVVSAKGGVLVIKARNGTEWNWDVASSSIVRESGKPASGSLLTSGAKVFVGGQIVGSSKDARLIVIHKKKPGGSGKNSSGKSEKSGKNSSSSSSAGNSSSGSAT